MESKCSPVAVVRVVVLVAAMLFSVSYNTVVEAQGGMGVGLSVVEQIGGVIKDAKTAVDNTKLDMDTTKQTGDTNQLSSENPGVITDSKPNIDIELPNNHDTLEVQDPWQVGALDDPPEVQDPSQAGALDEPKLRALRTPRNSMKRAASNYTTTEQVFIVIGPVSALIIILVLSLIVRHKVVQRRIIEAQKVLIRFAGDDSEPVVLLGPVEFMNIFTSQSSLEPHTLVPLLDQQGKQFCTKFPPSHLPRKVYIELTTNTTNTENTENIETIETNNKFVVLTENPKKLMSLPQLPFEMSTPTVTLKSATDCEWEIEKKGSHAHDNTTYVLKGFAAEGYAVPKVALFASWFASANYEVFPGLVRLEKGRAFVQDPLEFVEEDAFIFYY